MFHGSFIFHHYFQSVLVQLIKKISNTQYAYAAIHCIE